MANNYIGCPWPEVESILQDGGVSYTTVMTHPTKHFFRVDETRLYVLRVRKQTDGSLEILLAAKCLGAPPRAKT